MQGSPSLQLLSPGIMCVLQQAFQCRAGRVGPQVLLGCSGSGAYFLCTQNWGWVCCSLHQVHARGLWQKPPGMWTSDENSGRTEFWVKSDANMHLFKPLAAERKRSGICVLHKWIKHSWKTIREREKNAVFANTLHELVLLYMQWKVWLPH